MSKHTKGDWIADDSMNVFGPNGRLIANCGGWQSWREGSTSREENIANARLITAVHNLLYELGGIADALKAGDAVFIEPNSVKAKRIHEAMAKAE